MKRINEAIEKGANVYHPCDIRGMVQRGNAHLVTISRYVVLGHDSWIVNHCPVGSFKGNNETILEPLSWIGLRCIILPGAHIGKGCIIGAGSVVPKGYYRPYSIYAGNPARFIRSLTALEVLRNFNIRWKRGKGLSGRYDPKWELTTCEDINFVFDLPRDEMIDQDDPVGHILPWDKEEYDPMEFIEKYVKITEYF